MKIIITNKKTISELYDILSMGLGFQVSLESIDSILLCEQGIIILDAKNNWLGNFAYGKAIIEWINNKLNN